MKFLRCLLCASISCCLNAQVKDNFSDGDFTRNPAWEGDTSHFIINASRQLQLSNSAAASSFLVTGFVSSSLEKLRWEFYIKLSFSPSSSNFARVYLASDRMNLNDSLNGYYLQFGEALSNDKPELFRQNGKTSLSVCRGITSIAGGLSLRVMVECDTSGNWSVFTDPNGGTNYLPEASGKDQPVLSSKFLGVFCQYTISNAAAFYFDDFSAGPVFADTVGPLLDSVKVTGSRQLLVFFNEEPEPASAQNAQLYSAGKGVGSPANATPDSLFKNRVLLTFQNPFPEKTQIPFFISGMRDQSMNVSPLLADSFFYVVPRLYDVVINEIMADPDPPVNILPNYEYIELYNRTDFPFNLEKWKLAVGNYSRILTGGVIRPDSFLILCSSSAASAFGSTFPLLPVSSFPSLTNTGQKIVLSDSSGNVISAVSYTDKWYKIPGKEEGGWSLEQVDPLSPCSGENNWIAGNNPNGGTPGKSNSVLQKGSDKSPPALLRASVVSADTVQLIFSEAVNTQQAEMVSNYFISPGIGNPSKCIILQPEYIIVLLTMPAALLRGVIYTVTVADSLGDCSGNRITAGSSVQFAIAEKAESGDVLINEVLYDPKGDVPEFVEIVNASGKSIDLSDLRISTQDTVTGILTDISIISTESLLFFPGEFRVLSKSGEEIKKGYYSSNPAGFTNLSSFPSLNNSGDVIVLSESNGTILDRFQYNPTYHFPLLKETKGISLERISMKSKTQDRGNWHSAAASAGYATPSMKNSQSPTDAPPVSDFSLEPEIFSPDNDGFNDLLTISCHVSGSGNTANIYIYTPEGKAIRQVAKNELIAINSKYYWDGTTDLRQKASSGIYIVYIEVFDSEGNTKKMKLPCVVANRY